MGTMNITIKIARCNPVTFKSACILMLKEQRYQSSHVILPHFIWTEPTLKQPSSSWLQPIRTMQVAPSWLTAWPTLFWFVAVTANWVASQCTQFRGKRSNQMRWAIWMHINNCQLKPFDNEFTFL